MAENFWQTGAEGQSKSAKAEEAFFSVPPPPPEVKVRTMQSDLEGMARSGGLPHFQKIIAPKLAAAVRESEAPKKKTDWFWIIVPLIALGLITAIIYFAYRTFSEQGAELQGITSGIVPAGSQAGATGASRPVAAVPEFVHSSIFRKPAEETLTFVARSRVEEAGELQTFNQRVSSVLSGASAGSRFVEIRFQNDSGRDLSLVEVLSMQDALILPASFLSDKFSPDPTVFAFRENGAWRLGYVFALKPGESWLFLMEEISRLEASSKIENFFISYPGGRAGAFEYITVSGEPARKLRFSSGSEFLYGHLRGIMVLSASEEGYREAMARL